MAAFCSRDLLAPIRGCAAKNRSLGCPPEFPRWMIEQQILRELAFVLGDRGEALDAFGIDDGEIEARFRAVVEENGVHHLARAGGQTEADVGNPEHGA